MTVSEEAGRKGLHEVPSGLTVLARLPLCRHDEVEPSTFLAINDDAHSFSGIAVARLTGAGDIGNLKGDVLVVILHENEVDGAVGCVLPVDVGVLAVCPCDCTLVEVAGGVVEDQGRVDVLVLAGGEVCRHRRAGREVRWRGAGYSGAEEGGHQGRAWGNE